MDNLTLQPGPGLRPILSLDVEIRRYLEFVAMIREDRAEFLVPVPCARPKLTARKAVR